MSQHGLKVLAAVVLVLVLTVFLVERTDDSGPDLQGQVLLQGFRDEANAAEQVRIVQPDSDELTLQRDAKGWVVPARDDYVADIGKLRPLIVALTDARILEEKTSNPELYEKLSVDDPEDGGSGTKITIEGEGFSYAVILGDSATGKSRYARIPERGPGYLIDQNPAVPKEISKWLFPEIIDIDAQRIRSARIVHEDGETIGIEKSAEDLTDFSVLDIPAGRELNYASAGNSIAGALSDLKLEDARKAREDPEVQSTVVFDTWDGLRIAVEISSEDDESWVAFSANTVADTDSTETSADEVDGQESVPAKPDDEASGINDRLSGWQYRLPDYKKNQLTRRWEDLLKSTDTEISSE